MQDTAVFESYPTHPLGRRESWPPTGPVYGIPGPDAAPVRFRTFWQRLLPMAARATEDMGPAPAHGPVWY